MRTIVLIAHDIRSTYNVGALFRTAECMGVRRLYLSGYTPHPARHGDTRLPHIVTKLTKDIEKTALGTPQTLPWEYAPDVTQFINQLREDGFRIVGLEQTRQSLSLPGYEAPEKVALLIGREVEGIDPALLTLCDDIVEIPQFGQKESLNVIQATAMALYQLRFDRFAP